MSSKITFVIGGARSGKSSFVLNEGAKLEGQRAYIATGEALDDEMHDRIRKHKEDRGPEWSTYEEPFEIAKILSDIKDKYRLIVIDCLTLWLSNVLLRTKSQDQGTKTTDESMQEFIDELNRFKNGIRNPESEDRLTDHESRITDNGPRLFIVSNELGMGIVPENELAREFRDLTGFLNQKVAVIADEVYLVTAGIPLKIK